MRLAGLLGRTQASQDAEIIMLRHEVMVPRRGRLVTPRTLLAWHRRLTGRPSYRWTHRSRRRKVPHHLGRLQAVAELSDGEPDAMAGQATVGTCDEYEQLTSFHVVIEEHLAVPFQTTVLGAEVTVTKIDLVSGAGIAAICSRGKYRQAIGILGPPLPTPPPPGAGWIGACRHWATGRQRI